MRQASTWMCSGIGGAVFVVAHLLMATRWERFGGLHEPWFLNTGRAALFTATALFIAGSVIGAVSRDMRTSAVRATGAGIGATAAAVLTLFQVGPGTIFPLVMMAAALVLMASSLSGAMVAAGIKAVWRRRLSPLSPKR